MEGTLPAAIAVLAVAAVFITWTLASRRRAESGAAGAGEVAAAKALAQDAQDRLRALQSEAAARQEQI